LIWKATDVVAASTEDNCETVSELTGDNEPVSAELRRRVTKLQEAFKKFKMEIRDGGLEFAKGIIWEFDTVVKFLEKWNRKYHHIPYLTSWKRQRIQYCVDTNLSVPRQVFILYVLLDK
jgi:hypothetical protein